MQLSFPTPNPPKHACSYCGFDKTDGIVRCDDCEEKWFCNGPDQKSSHVVDHLSRSGHKKVSLYQKTFLDKTELECRHCGCRNLFSLGFIDSKSEGVLLLCRQPCQESSEPCPWQTNDWQCLVRERQILTWLIRAPNKWERLKCLKVTSGQTKALERLWKTDPNATLADITKQSGLQQNLWATRAKFDDPKDFSKFFGRLLQMERAHQKARSEEPIQENILVNWERNSTKSEWIAVFVLKSMELEMDIRRGDLLRLKHSNGAWKVEGIVVKISDANSDKFMLKMPANFVKKEEGGDFVLERVWNPTSFIRMQRALNKMCGDKLPMDAEIFRLLMGNCETFEKHQTSDESTNSDVDSVVLHNAEHLPTLNTSQMLAVKHALERPLSLIQGPPGTGKTVTCATIIYHLVKSNNHAKKSKVLVTAPSNVAVDHLAEKLHQTGLRVVRVYAVKQQTFESSASFLGLHRQVQNSKKFKDNFENGREGPRRKGKIGFFRIKKVCEQLILSDAEVVCCTCNAAGDFRLNNFNFDYVLIDECTQASEPECLVPIVKGAKKLVLIGDQCQLGPTVFHDRAAHEGLSRSLFERLIKVGIRPQSLQIQYRMHPLIAKFPSAHFYENFVLNGVQASDRTRKELDAFWPVPHQPIFFHSCNLWEEIAPSGTTYLNRGEAKIAVRLAVKLIKCGLKPKQIGVITPYLGQRRYLKQHMKYCGLLDKEQVKDLEVSSVDAFQGREKDLIIFSAVRSNQHQGMGFLCDPRRLNVALTRAKYGMVVIGNPVLLRRNSHWCQLLQFYKEHNCLIETSLDESLTGKLAKIDLNLDSKILSQNN